MAGAAGSTVLSIVIQARDEASKVMQSFKGTMLQASVQIAQAGFALAANYTKVADVIVNAISRIRAGMLQWVQSGGAGNFGASIGRDLLLIGRAFAALPGVIGLAGRAYTWFVTGLNQGIELLMKGVRLLKSVWENTFGGVVETAGSLVAVSRQLGITVEQVQDLQQVARETGANFEALQQIFTRTSRALVQANDENSRAGTILFQGLKLTREEFEKLKAASPLEQMVKLTEAFLKFGQNAQRNADMTAIFGQQWRQTIVMMAGGASTLKEAVERLNEQGRVTDELAQKANALQSAWAGVEGVFSGFNIKLFGDPELFRMI